MLAIGKWGADAQFVSNVAMNINLLLFIPAVGLHSGCSILAGQFAGAKQHRLAEFTTSAALAVGMVYTVVVCFCYLAIPGFFIGWFRGNVGPEEWERLAGIARVLLIFVAYYSLFDALGLVFSGCLKGAGDTRFVMLMAIITSQVFLTIPAIVLVNHRDAFEVLTGIYIMWGFCSLFITVQAGVFLLRYLAGRWKHMRVIEDTHLMAIIAEENARTEEPEIMPTGH
jgi:MATE family multidrug resistance protein